MPFSTSEHLPHSTWPSQQPTAEMRKPVSRKARWFGQGHIIRTERPLNPTSSEAKPCALHITQQIKMTGSQRGAISPNPSPGTFGNVWGHFEDHRGGGGCWWHLASGGQRCCYTSHRAHGSPSQRRVIQPQTQQCRGWETPPPTYHKGQITQSSDLSVQAHFPDYPIGPTCFPQRNFVDVCKGSWDNQKQLNG